MLAHYVGSGWRAPLSQRMAPVVSASTGMELGRIMLAGPDDVARAMASVEGAGLAGGLREDIARVLFARQQMQRVAAGHEGALALPRTEISHGRHLIRLLAPADLPRFVLPLLHEGAACVLLAAPAAALSSMVFADALHHAGVRQRLALLYV